MFHYVAMDNMNMKETQSPLFSYCPHFLCAPHYSLKF
jgi:hypothetical protein